MKTKKKVNIFTSSDLSWLRSAHYSVCGVSTLVPRDSTLSQLQGLVWRPFNKTASISPSDTAHSCPLPFWSTLSYWILKKCTDKERLPVDNWVFFKEARSAFSSAYEPTIMMAPGRIKFWRNQKKVRWQIEDRRSRWLPSVQRIRLDGGVKQDVKYIPYQEIVK